jgi:hypothetical protein
MFWGKHVLGQAMQGWRDQAGDPGKNWKNSLKYSRWLSGNKGTGQIFEASMT